MGWSTTSEITVRGSRKSISKLREALEKDGELPELSNPRKYRLHLCEVAIRLGYAEKEKVSAGYEMSDIEETRKFFREELHLPYNCTTIEDVRYDETNPGEITFVTDCWKNTCEHECVRMLMTVFDDISVKVHSTDDIEDLRDI